MSDTARAEKVLALFTSPDRAEAIAGDLAEARGERGSIRFWRHVLTTTLALCGDTFTRAPLASLGVAAAGCWLFASSAFVGVAAISLFPGLLGSAVSWIVLALLWWGGALFSGVLLVSMAPARGMATCVVLCVAIEALLIVSGLVVLHYEVLSASIVLFCAIAALAPAQLLTGGAIARRRALTMIGSRASAVFLLLAVATSASAQQVEWTDPSPHATTFVTVQDDVRLEVLDWGGSGRPLVLLAGLGDTAHVFDDFAPTLATRYRVLGVTRRAHGRSSAPATGYTSTRLAEDVARVLEAVGVKKPVIVGHSFAGEELHVLGARYSAQIAGLVYVDAAFNKAKAKPEPKPERADASHDYDAVARTLPAAPRPEPADMASFTALRAFLTRTQGPAGPDAHLRARYVANADGSVARPWVPDLSVRQALTNEMQAMSVAYNPERIRVPALAIYAVPSSAGDLMRPWYDADDPVVRERVQTLYRLARERFARHAKWFEAFAERGRISELAGAHHLFLSHPRDVLEQIEAFLSSLPETP